MYCKLAQATSAYSQHTRRIVSRDSVRVGVRRSGIIGGRICHVGGVGSDAEVCDSRVTLACRERLLRRQLAGKAPHNIIMSRSAVNVDERVSVEICSIVVVDQLFADSSHACGI